MKTPLERAYNWARRAYARRRSEPLLFEHCSHTAAKVMEEAEKRFDLPTHGVEGFSINMDSSLQYLNMGDTYARTIIFKSSSHNSGRWILGAWGDIVGIIEGWCSCGERDYQD